MTQKKRSKLGLPLLLGAATFALILIALWPNETPTTQLVVAARDLGAGAMLTSGDLTTITLEADLAPADAVGDPALLSVRAWRWFVSAVSGHTSPSRPHSRCATLRKSGIAQGESGSGSWQDPSPWHVGRCSGHTS